MTMKVYRNKPPEKQEALAKVQGAGHPDLAQEKGSVEKINPIDRADLSGNAKGISEMLKNINQLPEIRMYKVDAIQKTVNNGTYKIDPIKIAGKMIDEMV